MKVKGLKILILSFIFMFSLSSFLQAEESRNIYSRNCEVFIDKLLALQGSHGLRSVLVYMKTLNDRVDGEISKVGFYARVWQKDRNGDYSQLITDWHDIEAEIFPGTTNYWTFKLNIDHNFSLANRYEGVLFLETKNGSRYWLNSSQGNSHFYVDQLTHDVVKDFMGGVAVYQEDPDYGVHTQNLLQYYNPSRCY